MSGDNFCSTLEPSIVKVCFSTINVSRKRKIKEEQEKGHHDYQTESVLQRVAAASTADIMFIETSIPIVTMVGDR